MRKASIHLHGLPAGILTEERPGGPCGLAYLDGYEGPPLSVTMPPGSGPWSWDAFPPFFEGLLPEGVNRESALRDHSLEKGDLFGLLIATGEDTAGAIRVFPAGEESHARATAANPHDNHEKGSPS